MPLDATSARELNAQLKLAKSASLSFGLALGKKPEDTALVLDKKRPPDLLLKEAKKAPGVDKQKCCAGTVAVEGSTVLLHCQDAPPAGAVKKLKAFFRAAKINLKPMVVSPDGTEFEAEPDETADAGGGAPGSADEDAPADGQPADAPPPPPPPPPMELMARLKAAQPQIAALEGPAAAKLKGAYRDVAARVQDRDFDAASDMLSKIEAALEKLAKAQSASRPTDQPAAQSEGQPDAADETAPQEAGDPHKSRWEDMFRYRSELVAEAASAGSVDASKLRAAWAMAVEKAEAGQYKAADAIGERVEQMIARGGGDNNDPKNSADADAKKWALTKRKIDEVLTYVFMSNAGDMDRVRAIWDEMLACDKAKDYAGALALVPELQTVLKGVQEEQKKRKAKEKAEKKAKDKVARTSVRAVLKEFEKMRRTRLRDALDIDPSRKSEAGKLTKAMRKAVKALDTETAQDTLFALETLCFECETLEES